jgi:DNA-binding CsgD family transcriptional regulator/tetratricopeptide (TPR) repeat protein
MAQRAKAGTVEVKASHVPMISRPRRIGDDPQAMSDPPPSDARPLLGRQLEQRLISSLLADIAERGGALVLRGDPGIGKSRLLADAAAGARDSGIATLSTAGIQSEAHLAFAGLHLLLRPVRAHATKLPPLLATALDTAFGLTDDPPPLPFRTAMAVLDLLSEASTGQPLLLLIEDSHWLDRPTADVLTFVARRLDSDPIVLLAATREGYDSPLLAAGIPQHRIDGLDHDASVELLDTTARRLPAAVRARILRESAGNPLALLELPISAREKADDAAAGDLPLTAKLERAFAARVSELPDETRLLLLVTALSEQHDITEVLDAATLVSGTPMTIEMLEPAAQAGIVELDVRSVRFRHPLMRSAVRDSASIPQRRRAHQALADILQADPDRRVWHRAALLTGAHEDVALELEEAGRRARRRGALHVAITALRRAAELSDAAHRGRRLLAVAELAIELGQPQLAAPLLREVDDHSGPVERARATWIEEMISPPNLGDEARIARVVDAAERAGAAGDRDLHINLLWLAVSRAWWSDPGPAARRILVDAARRLGGPDHPDPRVLAIYTCADPPRHAGDVLPRLQSLAATRTLDAESARHLGPAALVLGAFDVAVDLLASAAAGARTEGRLGQLPRLLVLHGMVAAFLGEWDVALPAGEEARRLATELGAPLWIAGGETVISLVAGMRGDADAAERGAARAEQLGLAAGGKVTVALAQFGRVLSALGESRHGDAFACARRLFDPADPAHHPVVAGWLIGDLAEAALHVDRVDEGRRLLAQVEATAGPRPAVWIELNLRHARALLAHDEAEARRRFDDALAADLGRWPFQRARLLLAYGEWLRRQRRIAESRTPLRTAREIFDTLGCMSWSERARRELRASGESSRRRDPAARDQLTAQELQIAQLAAQGLSNRQIGQRLYVSHRTIGTHLYRIFPKLGITARGELETALSAPTTVPRRGAGAEGLVVPS